MRVSSRRSLACVIAAAALGGAVMAPTAGATTFCVPVAGPGCPPGGVAQSSLEAALQANSNDGIADTVVLGAGTYTDPDSFQVTGLDPLSIQGSGVATTVITSSANTNIYVLNLFNRPTVMSNVTVQIPASMPDVGGAGILPGAVTFVNVDVRSLNPGSAAVPSWSKGGTWTGGRIYGVSGGTLGTGVSQSGAVTGSVTLRNLTVSEAVVPFALSSPASTVLIEGARVSGASQSLVQVSGGQVTVRNSVFRTTGQSPAYVFVNSANNASLLFDHVTAVNTGGNVSAVQSQVGGGMTGNASFVVANSVLRGYQFSYLRSAPVSGALGNADLTVHHTNFPNAANTPGAEVDTGDGTTNVSQANIDTDPLFVSATDFALGQGSPSIDAADPADAVVTDILGAVRPVDGNEDGTAVADQGAFEFQLSALEQPPPGPPSKDTTPPNTLKVKSPAKKIRVRKAAVRFKSSEGASTFQCRIGKKAYRTCSSPLRLRNLKLGKHVVLVRAIDAAGNTDPSPLRIAFRVLPRR